MYFTKLIQLLLIFKIVYCTHHGHHRESYRREVEYYSRVVEDSYSNAFRYRAPPNAEGYAGRNRKPIHYGRYDYVIVGSGASGSVVGSRLSEVPEWQVLVLDAGGFGDSENLIPNLYFPVEFTSYNWNFTSTPQTTACLGMVDRICPYPRGRGIGGTTLINGLAYARGHSSDFNHWADLVDDDVWAYDNILPFFKLSENYVHRDPFAPVEPFYHGEGGLLNVEYHLPNSPQLLAWLQANVEVGYQLVDYNANRVGASPAQVNTRNGRRDDDGSSFIKPFLNRTNLHVLTHSYATRINIDRETRRARSVSFSHNNVNYIVEANREIIVSCGSLQSPQLLMLSGLGPRAHLEEMGIEVIEDLPTGQTLRDHPTFYGLNFGTNYTEPTHSLTDYVEQFIAGVGPLASPGQNQGIGMYPRKNSPTPDIPDLEIEFIPANATSVFSQASFRFTDETYDTVWGHINVTNTFIPYIVGLHSRSMGTVTLRSNNPYEYPVIDSRFLSDPENHDIDLIWNGIELMLEMSRTEGMQRIGTTLQARPLPACIRHHEFLSRDYWHCYIRHTSMNLYHPMGTCQMARDRTIGVTDSHARVFGVEGLRVVDASIFPSPIAGHPNAPSVMVGEVVSYLIRNNQ